jgi:hypothetical protein
VLDRCPQCRGLFVEASELAHLEREQPPLDGSEIRMHELMVSAGWALLDAKAIAYLIYRFLR